MRRRLLTATVLGLGGLCLALSGVAHDARANDPKDPKDPKGQKGPKAGGAKDEATAPPAVIEGAAGRALDQIILSLDKEQGGVSGVVLVAKKGVVLLEKGYGVADAATKAPVRADAPVEWASVSKQFTAAAVMRLVQAKKLGLDDPLSKHLERVPKDKAKVTIRQLLDHTSGIEAGFKNEWKFDPQKRDSLVQLVLGLPFTSKPGEKWEYSNSAYCLAAAIVEKVAGKPFEEFCETELFRPAGMAGGTFIGRPSLDVARVPKDDRGRGVPFAYGEKLTWAYRGCGGAVATVRDMFAWDRALRGAAVLAEASKKELSKVNLGDYALGWFVYEGPAGKRWEHGGAVGQTRAYFMRSIDDDIVVACVFTCVPSLHPAQIAEQLYRKAAE